MSGIIHLLPDAVANQIAAGEVIQRPASVVKELVENAVDSGADSITVNVKDAGKTLVQVIDNGCGMTGTDARLCWERHATSKITTAHDLFSIRTKGFRGEALASIAAIAEVSLKTKRREDELGTHMRVGGSEVQANEPVACQDGSNFMVKNLFYNVPARRKFLKTNSTELRHIINEFNHVALAHPGIEFSLIHNNSQIFSLPKGNQRQRIVNIMGKTMNQSLIPVETDTTVVRINGFIGKPEFARKTFGEQYFFVNGRYIRHPYFHKAVLQAYDQILQPDAIPAYFIFFDIDADRIDINIHPTKTELKFEDEPAIWQILHAVVRESIGRYNLSPSLDFQTEGVVDIPVLRKDTEIKMPSVNINPGFNPFEAESESARADRKNDGFTRPSSPRVAQNWQMLYGRREDTFPLKEDGEEEHSPNDPVNGQIRFMQFKNRYILTPVKSGLMLIDQKRAHERILYENNLEILRSRKGVIQQTLFPETFELNASDFVTFTEIREEVNKLGFDIREFGNNAIVIHGIPETAKNSDLKSLIEQMIENYKAYEADPKVELSEKIARAIARASAIPYGKVLEMEEMREIVDKLFGCANPNYSPSGRLIINIIKTEEIVKILNG